MSCGLDEKELFILNLLFTNRCLRVDRGYHSKKLEKLFRGKFKAEPKKAIKKLRNEGYIAPVGKSPEKYYICDIPKTFATLGQHDFTVPKGRERLM